MRPRDTYAGEFKCVFEFDGFCRRAYGTYQKNGDNLTTNWHFPESMKSNPFGGSVTRTQVGFELIAGDSVVAIIDGIHMFEFSKSIGNLQ